MQICAVDDAKLQAKAMLEDSGLTACLPNLANFARRMQQQIWTERNSFCKT